LKDNPSWCKNPQYFVVVKQPTLAKVILRKLGTKKYKGWKIGLNVCRYEAPEEKKFEKEPRRDKKNAGHNLQRLIQQTS
jgi:calpain, invertebrate